MATATTPERHAQWPRNFSNHPTPNVVLGCDRYCPATSMACGNGAGRTQHPAEMFGEDWYLDERWGIDPS